MRSWFGTSLQEKHGKVSSLFGKLLYLLSLWWNSNALFGIWCLCCLFVSTRVQLSSDGEARLSVIPEQQVALNNNYFPSLGTASDDAKRRELSDRDFPMEIFVLTSEIHNFFSFLWFWTSRISLNLRFKKQSSRQCGFDKVVMWVIRSLVAHETHPQSSYGQIWSHSPRVHETSGELICSVYLVMHGLIF